MIYTISAIGIASMFMFMALLVVCRSFAMRNENETPEAYEMRLWAKYSGAVPAEMKKAA